MTVLSVDLAFKRWPDIGVCALEAGEDAIVVEPISLPALPLPLSAAPTAAQVADALARLAERRGARLILLDGSQAWKDPDNGLEHCRRCERALATQGKTGLPGHAKPAGYAAFFAFAIEVFDRLGERGWPRLTDPAALGPDARFALESFPTSAWRSLGLAPLPGKANRKGPTVEAKLAELGRLFPLAIRGAGTLSHDELQATVAGLAGIGVAGHPSYTYALEGTPAFEREGTWREGFIVNPVVRSAAARRASWAGLRESAPDLEAAARRLLVGADGVALGMLATASRAARPHLAPVCPVFCGDHVYLVSAGHTPKTRDLRENGAFVLHALPGAADEELQVAGTARLVDDADERATVHAAIPFAAFSRSDPIFRLELERALWVRWERVGQPDTRAVRTRWRVP